MRKRLHTRAALSLLLIALTSCTGSRAFREARDEESLEHWDLAVINYSKAVRLDPKDRRGRGVRRVRRALQARRVLRVWPGRPAFQAQLVHRVRPVSLA